ncbi:hypothetical protein KCV06_g205, partial [Aureobasidium melanogenum]
MFDHELNSLASTLAIASSALALVTLYSLYSLLWSSILSSSLALYSKNSSTFPWRENQGGQLEFINVNQLYNLQSLVKRFEQSDKLTRPHRAGFHVQKRTYSGILSIWFRTGLCLSSRQFWLFKMRISMSPSLMQTSKFDRSSPLVSSNSVRACVIPSWVSWPRRSSSKSSGRKLVTLQARRMIRSVAAVIVCRAGVHQIYQLIGKMVGAEENALDTRPKHWVSSHLNQSLQAVLGEDEAAVCNLAGEAEVWQVFRCDSVGDLGATLRIGTVGGTSRDEVRVDVLVDMPEVAAHTVLSQCCSIQVALTLALLLCQPQNAMYIAQGKKSQVYLDGEPPSDIIITFYVTFLRLRLYPLLFQYISLLVFSTYLGAVSVLYSWVPNMAPRLPIVICMAVAVARFVWPDTMASGMFVGQQDDVTDHAGERRGHDEDVSAAELFSGNGVDDESVYSGRLRVWKCAQYNQTFGSLNAFNTSDHSNSSPLDASLSALRRAVTKAFSSGGRKVLLEGQSTMNHHICGKFAHERDQTYNDENPSPAVEACNAFHEADALTCISKALA